MRTFDDHEFEAIPNLAIGLLPLLIHLQNGLRLPVIGLDFGSDKRQDVNAFGFHFLAKIQFKHTAVYEEASEVFEQFILDFYHVIQRVAETLKEITSDPKQQQELTKKYKELLLEGGVSTLIDQLKTLAKKARCCIDTHIAYIESNAYRMKYDQYLQKGYMIGSGVIEAAHRTVIQARMKRSGQRWSKTGVDAMLKLRTRYESGRWEQVQKLVLNLNCKPLKIAA